jgi:hypothetical protein
MKAADLNRRIRRMARDHGVTAVLVRQGTHEIWECAGMRFPIPRHREIAEGTARAILDRLARHLERGATDGRDEP